MMALMAMIGMVVTSKGDGQIVRLVVVVDGGGGRAAVLLEVQLYRLRQLRRELQRRGGRIGSCPGATGVGVEISRRRNEQSP